MEKIIQSPGKYIQGAGELSKLPQRVADFGDAALVLLSGTMMRTKNDALKASFEAAGITYVSEKFGGECAQSEIGRLRKIVGDKGLKVVVGIGGGKTLDTAKAVAHYEGLPVIIAPSIASTDAPCSALSVIYTDDGVFESYLVLPKNPEMVIMDTDVVKQAPARLFVAGMGDALATYFEAQATYDSFSTVMSGGHVTNSALRLARLCFDILMADGLKAKLAIENHVCSAAVENVIEANTYLSGVGFESGGLAAAHAIHNGLTVLSECHHMYHGEKVAFGTIAQLIMENRPDDEIEEVLDFCESVGLPVTLKGLGCEEVTEEKIMAVAEASTAEGETIYNMPCEVTAESVYAAIMAADALGRWYLGEE
jgi:glycerol dehydrogenase